MNDTGGSFNLLLDITPPAGTFVNWVSDGSNGTDIFLSTSPPPFHSRGTNNSWAGSGWWGGTVPSANPNGAGPNLTLTNHDSGSDDIYMSPNLNQATGTGTTTWTISDNTNGASQYISELTLVNQGQIFVNGTNTFVAQIGATNWTMTGAGASTDTTRGNQLFDNEGAVNIIGNTSSSGQCDRRRYHRQH